MTAWRTSIMAGGRVALALVLMHEVIVPGVARAQGVFRVSPLFGTAQIYDTNLFSKPSDRQADFITRVSPGVEAEYRSALMTLLGRYTLDVDRFADHPELTKMDARQVAAVAVSYRPTPRLALAADAELSKTQTPGELNAETALALTRASAQRVVAHTSVTRQLDMVTAGTIDYVFTAYRVEGGLETRTHAARISTEHHLSLRDTMKVDYQLRQYFFGISSETSFALGLGWTRAITRRASLSAHGGPRMTNGSLAPDLSASVRYQVKPGDDVSLAYGRTQTTVIGLAGTADTQSVTITGAWSVRPSLQMRVSPAVFRSSHAGLQAHVYQLAVDVARPITNDFSIDVAFDTSLQHGNLYPAFAHERIPRHSVMISLVATPATRPH